MTSNPSEAAAVRYNRKDRRLLETIDEMVKAKEVFGTIRAEVNKQIKLIVTYIVQARLDEAEQLLKECQKQISPFKYAESGQKQKWFLLKRR